MQEVDQLSLARRKTTAVHQLLNASAPAHECDGVVIELAVWITKVETVLALGELSQPLLHLGHRLTHPAGTGANGPHVSL